jgi:hypothetical protein
LTIPVPDRFELYALGVGFLLALVAIAIGAALLVRRGLQLKKKAEALRILPFAPVLELTRARVDIASRAIDGAPRLIARAERALAAIFAARKSVTASALEARNFFRAMLSRS